MVEGHGEGYERMAGGLSTLDVFEWVFMSIRGVMGMGIPWYDASFLVL